MELGQKIKAKRKVERLSAEDLALKLGLKKENIYKWERGSKPSDPEDFEKINAWLNNLENVPRIPKKDGQGEKQESTDSILLYERLIAKTEESLRRAEEMNDRLMKLMENDVKALLTNSNQSLLYLETTLRHDRASHQVSHDNEDEIRHQPVGTSATKAGKLELDAAEYLQKSGKKNQGGAGKSRTGA